MDTSEVVKAMQILWANGVISADEYLVLLEKIESQKENKQETQEDKTDS